MNLDLSRQTGLCIQLRSQASIYKVCMCCLHRLCSQMSFETYLRVQMKVQGWIEASLKPHPESVTFNKTEFPVEGAVWQLYHAFQLFPW